jgi:Replication-relaxation
MTHFSSLPLPAPAILSSVARFRQLTTSQLRRLHYLHGSLRSREIRCSRHLKRLADLGLIRRVWGIYDRPEYVYMPEESKARTASAHSLDITELYVRLVNMSPGIYEGNAEKLIFDPEPWCHVQIGQMTLKPDFYLDLGSMRYFGELDRGTEFASQLAEKMRRYLRAYEAWDEPTFPLCVWIVHDPDRKRFIETVIKRQVEPRLFTVMLFDEVIPNLTEGLS